MPTEIQCPQGHRLLCPDDRAGKPGKCPKCGTSFQVPGRTIDSSGSSARLSGNKSGKQNLPTSATEGGAAIDGQIAFSCPNGHQLNGPANLQGQPGQCPRCGIKFRIPTGDDSEYWDESALAASHDDFDDDEIISMSDLDRISPFASHAPGAAGPGSSGVHAMEQLFATLWREREHGGVLEVHLEGLVIVPDWWAESLSSSTHAVFALQTADGSYVIEAVPWDNIRRLTVRRITELPDGVFQ